MHLPPLYFVLLLFVRERTLEGGGAVVVAVTVEELRPKNTVPDILSSGAVGVEKFSV